MSVYSDFSNSANGSSSLLRASSLAGDDFTAITVTGSTSSSSRSFVDEDITNESITSTRTTTSRTSMISSTCSSLSCGQRRAYNLFFEYVNLVTYLKGFLSPGDEKRLQILGCEKKFIHRSGESLTEYAKQLRTALEKAQKDFLEESGLTFCVNHSFWQNIVDISVHEMSPTILNRSLTSMKTMLRRMRTLRYPGRLEDKRLYYATHRIAFFEDLVYYLFSPAGVKEVWRYYYTTDVHQDQLDRKMKRG